eukprot:CAMPEP_0206142378 /NCGR_PEP_ID=MMETSP1473-20131121/16630_1 /ASSEMBLY_ACC=CAM_ASM_001109 /TAXON_ID=1461547 /ORGANISM="Stichococcus sp, Strain RCC1054" /LENGTH=440 /DNA_ID=CAMNT_0053537357 /DNA_START=156 /DNA_END=1478 /DNA_ORIENTATION=-
MTTVAKAAGVRSCDIAVVGGGLGGLVSAAAIRRALPDIDVKVFEQSPTFAKAGALLGVSVNAQNAIQAINPSLMEQIDSVVVKSGKSFAYNHTGELVRESVVGKPTDDDKEGNSLMQKYGRSIMRLGWWEVHKILAGAQPEGSVIFNSKFSEYEEHGDGVAVRFNTQGECADEWTAKLVVGADGAFSPVRRQCLDDGKPDFAGSVIWRARLPTTSMKGLLDDGVIERSWFGNQRFANLWMVNEQENEGCWVFGTSADVLAEMGVNFSKDPGAKVGYQTQPIGKNALERAKRVAACFPAQFQQVLEGTDPDTVVEHGMWTRSVTGPWGRGRVTLSGDAAHPMRPATGQGLGQAAEDAHALALALQEHGLTAEALRAYEDSRWERVKVIGDVEQALAMSAYSKKAQDTTEKHNEILTTSNYQEMCFGAKFAPLQPQLTPALV